MTEIKVTRRVHLEIRLNLRSVLVNFQSFTEKPVFECAFAHPMLLFYHIWLKTVLDGSRLQKNMKRRGGKREGAGRKKSPALAKITREINQKHWRTNHHYIYLENRVCSTWQKVRAEGAFVNDSNFASWLLAGLELRRRREQ